MRFTRHTFTDTSLSHRKLTRRSSSQNFTLRYIPPEVWGVVIEHACLQHHDPLDTSHELSFLEESSTQLTTYRAAMRDKVTLSLVSKQWHAYARDFLYEFIWISSAAQAKSLAHTLLMQSLVVQPQSSSMPTLGSFIRRLHIETPVLERCAPADLRSILDNAPGLSIYSDRHSVQRSLYCDGPDPRCSSEEILRLVANSKIRRLSWTSYGDAPFQQRMTPLLTNIAVQLEYLELSSCSPNFRTVFPQTQGLNLDETRMDVCLPSLRALKVSLDNNTFAVLASWDMPQLTNLSVLSSDFSYTGPGFASFFQAHGTKLTQLELGHSSSLIEEHYLTAPHHSHPSTPVPLAEWCPNLREFICSADAEWHWQSPDWIAAHILLPAHPRIELIGIRDIDARLRDDPFIPSGEPYFTLYEQLCSLLQTDAFPALRFVRDMSKESHAMRSYSPQPHVSQFWHRVVNRCKEREVWLEDCTGVNVTARSLLRAAHLHTPAY